MHLLDAKARMTILGLFEEIGRVLKRTRAENPLKLGSLILPPDWVAKKLKDGRTLYYNNKTAQSAFEKPKDGELEKAHNDKVWNEYREIVSKADAETHKREDIIRF